jgi:hypothetical protein
LRNNYIYHVGTELGPHPGVVVDHNLVFRSLSDSGLIDATRFVPSASSPVAKAAGVIDYIKEDLYHRPRYSTGFADAGAVQHEQV